MSCPPSSIQKKWAKILKNLFSKYQYTYLPSAGVYISLK